MKKIFAAVMALFILVIPALGVSAEETDNAGSDPYTAFGNLLTAWAEAGYAMYPEYVGGVYFSEDGSLVVALSDDSDANRNEIKHLSGAPDVIEFKTVKYSYDELQTVIDEISKNDDSYDFLINYVNISEQKNVVEVSVGSADVAAASSLFTSLYGDKVAVHGEYDIVSDTDFEENTSNGTAEKIASTKELRRYISLGVIGVLAVVVLITTLNASSKSKSSKRRYRK